MAHVVAIINQKGGVGKSTTAINLAACLGDLGKRVLVVDFDPQGNATSGFGVDKDSLESDVYESLMNDVPLSEVVVPSPVEGVFVAPATIQLAGAEIELVSVMARESVLRYVLEPVRDAYDYIFVDCPPSMRLSSIFQVTAVDSVLIPIQCEFYALEGVSQLMSTIDIVKKNLNPSLEIEGVILSMFDGRTNLSIQVVEEAKKYFKEKVYTTVIPRNVRLAEAPSHGVPVIHYDPRSTGAKAYTEFAEEFLEAEEGR